MNSKSRIFVKWFYIDSQREKKEKEWKHIEKNCGSIQKTE